MTGWRILAEAFRGELAKVAAETKKKPSNGAVEMPPSPVAMENNALEEQLNNLNLRMQIRQATQAWTAAQQQDAEAEQQAAAGAQGGQPGVPGAPPGSPPGAPTGAQPGQPNPFMGNPAMARPGVGLPSSPTEMIGAQ